MPTSSKGGKRSKGRNSAAWDKLRRRWMRTSRICHVCSEIIPEGPEYSWPHPLSYTLDHHPLPLSQMDGPDDPRATSFEWTRPCHLVCNQRKGDRPLAERVEHPTSRNWTD